MAQLQEFTDEEIDAIMAGEADEADDGGLTATQQALELPDLTAGDLDEFKTSQKKAQIQRDFPKTDRTDLATQGLPPRTDPLSDQGQINQAARNALGPGARQTGLIEPEFSDDDIDFALGIQSQDQIEDFQRAELEAELQAEGVDTTTGADTGLRAKLAFQTDDRIRQDIIKDAGLNIVEETALGRVLETEDGKRFLLDETGTSFNDFVDTLGLVTEVGGSVGAAGAFFVLAPPALAASPAALALAAIFAAVGGQTARGGVEFFTALSNGGMDLSTEEGRDRLETIFKNGAENAVLDTTLDLLFQSGYFLRHYGPNAKAKLKAVLKKSKAAGGKLFDKAKKKFGKDIKDELEDVTTPADARVQELIEEALQRGELKGEVSEGLESGSTLIQRFEGLTEKLPFVGKHIRKIKGKEKTGIGRFQGRLLDMMDTLPGFSEGVRKTLAEYEKDVATPLLRGNEFLEMLATGGRREVRALAQGQLDAMANKLSRTETKFSHAGDAARKEIHLKEGDFQLAQTELKTSTDNLMRQLPPAKQKFVRQTKVREQFRKIRAKGVRNQSGQFIIEGTPAKINSLENIVNQMFTEKGTTTVANMRAFRQLINDEIRNPTGKFEGIAQTDLRLMASAATDAINDSVAIIQKRHPEVGKALRKEINHYKANIDRFNNDQISKVFKKDGVIDEDILPNLFFRKGGREQIEKVFDAIGEDSRAAFINKNAVFNRMLRESSEDMSAFGAGKVIDPAKLEARINQMKEAGTYDILIREKGMRDEIDRLVALLKAEGGGVGIDSRMLKAFNAGNDTEQAFVDTLQKSLDIEKELQSTFTTNIKKSLKNGVVPDELAPGFTFRQMKDAVEGDAEGMIGRILKLDTETLKELMDTWPPAAKDEFKAHVIAIMLERGARKTATPDERILKFTDDESTVSRQFLDELSILSPTTAESKRKLNVIFSPEEMRDLQAMGVLGEVLLQSDKIASMVGGLIAGSQAARIVRSGPKDVAAELARWSIIAHAIEAIPKFRKLMNKGLPKGKSQDVLSVRNRIFRANLPELSRLAGEAVAEDSELTRFIEETTGQDALQFTRDMFDLTGGETFRKSLGTSTRKNVVKHREPPKSPEDVANELFEVPSVGTRRPSFP